MRYKVLSIAERKQSSIIVRRGFEQPDERYKPKKRRSRWGKERGNSLLSLAACTRSPESRADTGPAGRPFVVNPRWIVFRIYSD